VERPESAIRGVGILWALGSSLHDHLGRIYALVRVQVEDHMGVGGMRHRRTTALESPTPTAQPHARAESAAAAYVARNLGATPWP
jgi:hypothetical protein